MNATDYYFILNRLDYIISNDTFGVDAVRSNAETIDREPEQIKPGEIGVPINKYHVLDSVEQVQEIVIANLKKCYDGWSKENQTRADQGLGITKNGRDLYDKMVLFLSKTEVPIPKAGGLYRELREQCHHWIEQLSYWYPQLSEFSESDKKDLISRDATKKPRTIDKVNLNACFEDRYTSNLDWLDRIHYALTQANFKTKNDWASLAVFIKKDCKQRNSRLSVLDYSVWIPEFCSYMDVEPPKDLHPGHHKVEDCPRVEAFIKKWF